ncbi:MAG: GTP-binding protein, partial [Candidatus Hydrogenedentales bacterium]
MGILGHGGTGKTMLIEHVLHSVGKTSRLGKIAEGNTVCDYLEEEIQRQQTIAMKLAYLDWNGTRVHLIDHPGYADFLGEVAASVPVLDAVVIVVDATTGIQVGTDNAMQYADRYGAARAIFVNKLDRDHTDFHQTVALLQQAYGNRCVPLVIPTGQASGLKGCVNILTDQVTEHADEIEALRAGMTDVVAEVDDALLEKFLETGELSAEEFDEGLHKGIQQGKIIPIICGSVDKDVGIRELFECIVKSFPTPLERKVVGRNAAGEEVELQVSAD